jgi:hypothetical protein
MSDSKGGAFADVRNLNKTAKELLARYGRTAIQAKSTVIEDPEAKKKADEIIDLLDKDVREYSAAIDKVESSHKKWPAAPKRAAHYQNALVVGSQYVEIIDNIQNTMGTPAIDLFEIIAEHTPTAPSAE